MASDQLNTDDISDGYHTFGELYAHRRALTRALMIAVRGLSWRSRQHHPADAQPMYPNHFIVGIELPTGSVRYHYRLEHWDEFEGITELTTAPVWDQVNDNIGRLLTWHRSDPTPRRTT